MVAPQGTAFTEGQARILKRYVNEVVLCFDADAAGQKAAERSLEPLLENNLVVRVAEMPPGEDPDSLVRKEGAEKFSARIAAAPRFFRFLDRAKRRGDRPDELERQNAAGPAAGRDGCARARPAHAQRSDQQSCRAARRRARRISPISCRKRRATRTPEATPRTVAPAPRHEIAHALPPRAARSAALATFFSGQDWHEVMEETPGSEMLATDPRERSAPGRPGLA